MRYRRLFLLLAACALTLSCQNVQQRSPGSEPPVPSYLELLERLEVAGNRYRRATDLVRYSSSSFERSLAESHLQFTKEVLESEFELAEIEAKTLALNQPGASESGAPSAAEQSQYDKIAAEVWRLSAEVDEAKERLAAARQNLKKAATAEAFRKVQQTVDQLQKEVEIADKKLDLAGSNLDIQDYKRKRSTTGSSDALSFGERLKMMRNEILPASRPAAPGPARSAEPAPETAATESQGGIVASVRDYFARREKFKSLRQAQQATQELVNRVKGSLERRQRELETLQAKHLELNRKTESAYSQAYQLLQKGGEAAGVARILEEADRQMSDSAHLEQQKELASRALNVVRRQAVLVRDDNEKLASWTGIATEESNDSLFRVGNRIGIVLALILAILVLSHYLKKLPYKFTREGKNLYYFRKLISFTSGLLIAVIVVLNFMGDFGSLTAVLGLAGAGLAIALQDPIVSLVGWFLIVGRFGISVGDRVEINQVKGDVIDIGLLRIAVLEVGNWVGAEQSTGRVVFFPNSFIFKSHYFNYSTGNSFIWDEIRFTVTYESDWKRAREILEEVATRASQAFVDAAKTSQAQLERQYHINLGTLTPYVYVSIASNGVDLVLRYLTGIRKRRSTQDQICQEILQAFGNEPGIELSAPARRPAAEAKPAIATTPEPAAG
jgi:small-conductance mechanosensitive channel/predicted  nucleic acid-binding Zn-ribbon protein